MLLLILVIIFVSARKLHSVVILNETKAPKGFTPPHYLDFLSYIYTPPCNFKLKKKKSMSADGSAHQWKAKKEETWSMRPWPGPFQPDAAKYAFKCVW